MEITDKNNKISIMEFYNFLIENKENCNIIYSDYFSKRYWIMDIYSSEININKPIINLYMEYETTTLKEGRITRHRMINELSPLMRRYKINKIMKNKT